MPRADRLNATGIDGTKIPQEIDMNVCAGLWLRFCAYVVDAALCFVIILAVTLTIGTLGELSSSTEAIIEILTRLWIVVLTWFYFAVMESSTRQGSIGKQLLRIRVTDVNAQRISLTRATVRHFAKGVSWWTLGLGFIIAGITKRKQALHDLLAGTVVLTKKEVHSMSHQAERSHPAATCGKPRPPAGSQE